MPPQSLKWAEKFRNTFRGAEQGQSSRQCSLGYTY